MASNGTTTQKTPKIILYTNHGCPYAQRAHITLKELGLEYEEVIIDLSVPREPWYLEVNPRGLVPSIKYSDGTLKDEIITESSIVAQFLVDGHSSSLLPPADSSPTAPLFRARVNFFTDTFNTKINPFLWKIAGTEGVEAQEALVKDAIATVQKELEPLLHNVAPFFGGSKNLTFAEAIVAPFVLRFYALARSGIVPASLAQGLDKLPNFSKWAAAVTSHESVTQIWNEEKFVSNAKDRLPKFRAMAKAAN